MSRRTVAMVERWLETLAAGRAPSARRDAFPIAAEPWFGAGNGFAAYPELASGPGISRVLPDAACDGARGAASSRMPRLLAGEGVAADDALPLYVRHRVALTTAERAAGARL